MGERWSNSPKVPSLILSHGSYQVDEFDQDQTFLYSSFYNDLRYAS